MPSEEAIRSSRPVTRSRLASDLAGLGVRGGDLLMVHTRMSALGWVVGGSQTVVQALLDAVGPGGTVAAYAGWEDDAYGLSQWPEAWQRAYLEEMPTFDAALSEAVHGHGRIPERIRTWPGAHTSPHPEARVVAIGRQAEWLTSEHPLDDAYGPGTPFARLVDAGGRVLLLGAPLNTLTLLHHAEALAEVPNKRRVTYRAPMLLNGRRRWVSLQDIDTSTGALPYEEVVGSDGDAFEVIAAEALEAGCGRDGKVGQADSHLFDASALIRFAKAWMEQRFGKATPQTAG